MSLLLITVQAPVNVNDAAFFIAAEDRDMEEPADDEEPEAASAEKPLNSEFGVENLPSKFSMDEREEENRFLSLSMEEGREEIVVRAELLLSMMLSLLVSLL